VQGTAYKQFVVVAVFNLTCPG